MYIILYTQLECTYLCKFNVHNFPKNINILLYKKKKYSILCIIVHIFSKNIDNYVYLM